jgi:ABC-type Fe3+ transport system substrate-binding protein
MAARRSRRRKTESPKPEDDRTRTISASDRLPSSPLDFFTRGGSERARRTGKPIDFLTPSPVIVGLEPVAIAKNAPHPVAARILVDWLLSKEMQQFFADERTSARSDVTNDARIFNLKMPFYILHAPDKTEYNAWVSAYKALLGIAA